MIRDLIPIREDGISFNFDAEEEPRSSLVGRRNVISNAGSSVDRSGSSGRGAFECSEHRNSVNFHRISTVFR
jgi:hypothetical protein